MHRPNAHICNTSPPLKKNFGSQGVTKFDKIFSPCLHTQVKTFYKAYFSKYKSKIGTMYNLYKLINYKYANYTLNTVSGQSIRTDIILSFNMFYLKIVFLQH